MMTLEITTVTLLAFLFCISFILFCPQIVTRDTILHRRIVLTKKILDSSHYHCYIIWPEVNDMCILRSGLELLRNFFYWQGSTDGWWLVGLFILLTQQA